ncbi:hypothetical protein [Roseovarius sp. MBR-6]|uniref:hypothetical protein n=1 Tax=Roseovarius sp. MBR-6 TaxID=3156459 RepID=UPI00339A3C3C
MIAQERGKTGLPFAREQVPGGAPDMDHTPPCPGHHDGRGILFDHPVRGNRHRRMICGPLMRYPQPERRQKHNRGCKSQHQAQVPVTGQQRGKPKDHCSEHDHRRASPQRRATEFAILSGKTEQRHPTPLSCETLSA